MWAGGQRVGDGRGMQRVIALVILIRWARPEKGTTGEYREHDSLNTSVLRVSRHTQMLTRLAVSTLQNAALSVVTSVSFLKCHYAFFFEEMGTTTHPSYPS